MGLGCDMAGQTLELCKRVCCEETACAICARSRLLPTLRELSAYCPCSKEELKQLFTLNTGKWGSGFAHWLLFRRFAGAGARACCSAGVLGLYGTSLLLNMCPFLLQQQAATPPTSFSRLVKGWGVC